MKARHLVASLVRGIATRRHRDDAYRTLTAARAVMRSCTYCVVVTSGPHGPSARIVQPFPPDDGLTVHLGTDPTSRKAREVSANGEAVLVYQRDRDRAGVVAYCRAEDLSNADSRRRYFMPFWRAFWPAGPDDRFTVIRCSPYALEVWDARRGVTPPPFGLRSARLLRARDGTWQLDGQRP